VIEWDALIDGFGDEQEAELIDFIARQRWFGNKAKSIVSVGLVDLIEIATGPPRRLALIDVHFGDGTSEVYQLTLELLAQSELGEHTDHLITTVGETVIREATEDKAMAQLLTATPRAGSSIPGVSGELHLDNIGAITLDGGDGTILSGEQSNTSVVHDGRLLLKTYRRIEAGINPELELMLFLTETGFAHVPALSGWITYRGSDVQATLAIAQRFIPDAIDGWSLGLDQLEHAPSVFLDHLRAIGTVIGEMHRTLASELDDNDFAPEEASDEWVAIVGAQLEAQIDSMTELLPQGRSEDLRRLARELTNHAAIGKLIRSHGDLHLGQMLYADGEWLVIDFEGEPARRLPERRRKFHPLRDVAGMMRSIAYLVAALEIDKKLEAPPDWEADAQAIFFGAYREQVRGLDLFPDDPASQDAMIQVFALEKLLYELDYERQHRPDWLAVPLRGIERLLGRS
jgi:trehalose synthase-fused probable maltokinase